MEKPRRIRFLTGCRSHPTGCFGIAMVACGSAPYGIAGCCIFTGGERIGLPTLSSESVNSLFEGREGNIWVATIEGLDRFRDFAVPTFSDQQGFSSRGLFSILAARDGSLW